MSKFQPGFQQIFFPDLSGGLIIPFIEHFTIQMLIIINKRTGVGEIINHLFKLMAVVQVNQIIIKLRIVFNGIHDLCYDFKNFTSINIFLM